MSPQRTSGNSPSTWQSVPGGSEHPQQRQQQHPQPHYQQHPQQREVNNNNRTEEGAYIAPIEHMSRWTPQYYSYYNGQPPMMTPSGPPGAGGVIYPGYDYPARPPLRYTRPPPSGYQNGGRNDFPDQHMAPPLPAVLGYNANPETSGVHNQLFPLSFMPGFAEVQDSKRRRRRPEEIERIYKCGWDGCTKGYGTLNHLNAHVTMQGHGEKRKPEEFKELRRQWKERKREAERQGRQRSTDFDKAERSRGG
ncbi:C2H2 transcription factor (Con7) [Apiospora phragmitis]|uniref:C2H2 transcription factor (Con7) n=1 Tax=Apiospora phragmitis TaxID=2905665 RepID=A0ABR1W3M7_9PEZI